MCGLVGAVAHDDVRPLLVEGLKRLEYRGYDSAGLAMLNGSGKLETLRRVGKVSELENILKQKSDALSGWVGIGHTRWATHGGPDEKNAHPHTSHNEIAVVHNGIIENHTVLKNALHEQGYQFLSDTDTEVIAHLIHSHKMAGCTLTEAVRRAARELTGAFAIAVIDINEPKTLVAARRNSPLVVGIDEQKHYVASDISALLPVTNRFIYLEEDDIAQIKDGGVSVINIHGKPVNRPVLQSELTSDAISKGNYAHFMLKEIFEQPHALSDTIQGCVADRVLLQESLGFKANDLIKQIESVHVVACGTSNHAGEVARYWMESIARIPCNVELASEYRYREPMVPKNCLFVAISQSGETADTLAALRFAKEAGYLATMAICNVPESSLVRESDLTLLTRAGPEIGVASTKAFTTQLLSMLMLIVLLARRRISKEKERRLTGELIDIASHIERMLAMDEMIQNIAADFLYTRHCLFLGRGPMFPIAKEGALKLKEISYIHAEAYAAGELKHGPLALVDKTMPVVVLAPNDSWVEKVKSNIEEVRARGGQLYVFADPNAGIEPAAGVNVIEMPYVESMTAPLLYTIPMQLLAYHVAVLRGTDVDKPRNLAKSVTVE